MSRLPAPGQDNNTWGDILNDYLSQEHNADGSQKPLPQSKITNLSSDLTSKADDSTVVHSSGDETIAGIKTFSASPIIPTPTSGTQATNKTYVDSAAASGTPDATSSVKGKLQLAGDLAGTASAPTVPTAVKKGDLVINVKDYGAVGNGTTDDAAAIQSAIAASPTNATVYFPPGTYIVSTPIVFLGSRSYLGSGGGLGGISKVKLANGSNPTASGGATAVFVPQSWNANATGGDFPVTFAHLEIDGNKANNGSSQACGVILLNYWSQIHDCYIHDTNLDNIRLTDATANGTAVTSATGSENRIYNNHLVNAGACAFRQVLVGATGTNFDGFFEANTISGPLGTGAIVFDNATGWSIRGNHSYGVRGHGIYCPTAFATQIENNYLEDFGKANTAAATYYGIYAYNFAGRGVTIVNNSIACTEPAANTSTYVYININGNATSSTIAVVAGNQMRGEPATAQGTAILATAINVSGAWYVSIYGNNTSTVNTAFSQSGAGNITLSTTVRGTLSAQALSATGLSGATSFGGGRYVGAVNNAAPASGTFLQGDYVVDGGGSGGFWVCTVSGSPGTWTALGPRSGTAALALGTASAGTNNAVSRVDHVHPTTGLAVLANANTFTGSNNVQTGTAWAAAGLTGATAASRYVGATASGAPASGTFAVGDFAVDQTGNIWICTTAGTPGTWVGVSTGAINYASITNVRVPRPASGEFVVSPHSSTSSTQFSTGNQMILMPVDVAISTTFSGIASNISTVGTGAGLVIRLGYYADDGTGARPIGAALQDAGTFDATTGTGDRLIAFGSNQVLAPGRYWLAWTLQGTVTTGPFCTVLSLMNQTGLANLGNNSHRCWAQSSVSGALPTIGSLFRTGSNPIIGLKIA